MILDRCEKLRTRIAEKQQLEQSVNQIRRFRKVRDLFVEQRNSLAPLYAVWQTLRQANVLKGPAPAEVAPAVESVEGAQREFRAAADSLIDERSFSPIAFGQTFSAAVNAIQGVLDDVWQHYAAERVPPTNSEVLDALAPAFPREVRTIRRSAQELDRLRSILPSSGEQFQRFEDEVAALHQAWGQLGGGDVPQSILAFLKRAATPAGARLDQLTDEVRTWLSQHGIIRSFYIRVAGPGQ